LLRGNDHVFKRRTLWRWGQWAAFVTDGAVALGGIPNRCRRDTEAVTKLALSVIQSDGFADDKPTYEDRSGSTFESPNSHRAQLIAWDF
jgi:hypothetical protein